MSKLALLGSIFFLLLCAVVLFVFRRFPIGCLFVPCDRSVEFVLQPPEQNLKGCDLLLFDPDDKTLSNPLRRLEIEDHTAEVIVQPRWTESYLVALSCKGLPLSDSQLIEYGGKESVNLHLRKPAAKAGV